MNVQNWLPGILSILVSVIITQCILGIKAWIAMSKKFAVSETNNGNAITTLTTAINSLKEEHGKEIKRITEEHEKQVTRLEADITVLRDGNIARDKMFGEVRDSVIRMEQGFKYFGDTLQRVEKSINDKRS